jgi:hypothetical protein
MSRHLPFAAICLLLLVVGVGCGDDVCSDPSLIGAAAAGQTVVADGCRIEGDVRVPSGVTFEGRGGAVVAGQVVLEPGSRLVGVIVESPGPTGVLATGATGDAESVVLERVEVRPTSGVAVRIEGLGASLTNVVLSGTVDRDNADAVPPMPESSEWPTHGLLLVDAGSTASPVSLDDVSINGFARFGALFRNSHVIWRGGEASRNLTVGAMAERGTLTLEGVGFRENYQGVQPYPAFGAVFTAGIEVSSTDLEARGNEGYGVLHDGATAGHVDLLASDNGDAAVWVQSSSAFMLAGASSSLSGNRLAGIVVVDSPNAMIQDATIDTSILGTRIDGETGRVDVGDGIHAVLSSAAGFMVDGVSMTGNERTGVLLDVADADVDGVFMRVTVDGAGDSLGVIAQGPAGIIPSGVWDADVNRLGVTAANDSALEDVLDIVGLVGPMFLPPPSM